MAQIDYIKDLYENEEVSLREISRRTRHSFQTVQKYAKRDNWSADHLPNLEAENYPNLEKYIPSIDEWMEADRKIPRKQRHTAMRIYRRLVEEQGYQGSYSSVKRYVRKKKFMQRMATEGYLPLSQPAGQGQVDFGESLYFVERNSALLRFRLRRKLRPLHSFLLSPQNQGMALWGPILGQRAEGLGTDRVVPAVQQGIHTVFPVAEPGMSAGRLKADL